MIAWRTQNSCGKLRSNDFAELREAMAEIVRQPYELEWVEEIVRQDGW